MTIKLHPRTNEIFKANETDISLKEARGRLQTILGPKSIKHVPQLGDREDKIWKGIQIFVVVAGFITLPILMSVYHVTSSARIPSSFYHSLIGTTVGTIVSGLGLQGIKEGRQHKRITKEQLSEMLTEFRAKMGNSELAHDNVFQINIKLDQNTVFSLNS